MNRTEQILKSIVTTVLIVFTISLKLPVQAQEDTDWQEEYDYTLSENEITLLSYNGTESEITVPAQAVIDEEEYEIVLSDAQWSESGYVGIWSEQPSVTSLSFEDGVKLPEDCTALFRNCSNLRELDLSGLDASDVVCMTGMFADCSSLKTITFGNLSTGKVTDMTSLFQNCRSLKSISVSGLDASHITSMNQMFAGCSSLENLDLQDFHPGDLHSMRRTFAGCSALKWIRFGSIDTGKVTTLEGCFAGCSNLSQLDLSSFATGNLVVAGEMFSGCTGLSSLDLSGFDLRNLRGEVSYGSGNGSVAKDMLRDVRADVIITPRNLKEDVALSAVYIEESSGTIYRQLPKNSSFPRVLIKMSYDVGAQLVVSGDDILYYVDGEQDLDTYGFVSYDSGLFLIAHGRVATEIDGLYQDPEYPQFWYYCSEGQAHTEYSGVVEYDGEYFLVKDGVLDTGANGFYECDDGSCLVAAGRILSEAEGLIQDPKHRDCWYYCEAGRVVQDYYGKIWYDGAEFYVSGGRYRAVY